MGLAVVPSTEGKLEATIGEALEAVRKGRARGGDQLCSIARTDADARVQAYDAVWVKHLKAALAENRFRLVQQPIASLAGGNEAMFDMLVRILDKTGKEVLPSEFMAAAETRCTGFGNDSIRPGSANSSSACAAVSRPASPSIRTQGSIARRISSLGSRRR